jgi:hypothetical protein
MVERFLSRPLEAIRQARVRFSSDACASGPFESLHDYGLGRFSGGTTASSLVCLGREAASGAGTSFRDAQPLQREDFRPGAQLWWAPRPSKSERFDNLLQLLEAGFKLD